MLNLARLAAQARVPGWLRQEYRALAAYYRAGGTEHPDRAMTGHYMIWIKVQKNEYAPDGMQYRKFIKLANASGTLAVFTFYNGKMRRLTSWPASIETGTAQTEDDVMCEASEYIADPDAEPKESGDKNDLFGDFGDEIGGLLDELDAV